MPHETRPTATPHDTKFLKSGQPLGHAFAMDPLPPPLAFFCLLFSGWVNRQQQAPSRPGEFHPEPLTEPCVSLSTHTARPTR